MLLTLLYQHVILNYMKIVMNNINKKYAEIMQQADNAVGRKEVVKLLKKAAKIKAIHQENLAA